LILIGLKKNVIEHINYILFTFNVLIIFALVSPMMQNNFQHIFCIHKAFMDI